MFVGHENGRPDPWLFNEGDAYRVGHVRRIVQFKDAAVRLMDAIDNRWRSGDQVNPEFAIQSFADDFEMQQPQKSATESEAQCGRCFGFESEACIVEMQLAERVAEGLEFRGIDGEKTAEHHLLGRFE